MEQFAIGLLSVVPVRKTKEDSSEMVTQLLFGDMVSVLSLEQNWTHVKMVEDGYEGWVDSKQITCLEEIEYLKYIREKMPVVLENPLELFMNNRRLLLSVGSKLPFFEKGNILFRNQKWSTKGAIGFYDFSDLNRVIGLFLGTPYLWGGRSQFGIDCSGFTQLVFRMCGKQIDRDASMQVLQGEGVSFEETRPGDLAFFSNDKGKVTHVGIVMDQSTIVHAHGEVRVDVLSDQGIYNTEKQYISHYLHSIRRFF